MLNATRSDSEPQIDEAYPLVLLKQLLQQMMTRFAANGACLALLDENSGKMVIRLHVRARGANPTSIYSNRNSNGKSLLNRRTTINLNNSSPGTSPLRYSDQQFEKMDFTIVNNGDFFPIGSSYTMGEDLIGITWYHNEAYVMRHEDYISAFSPNRNKPPQPEVIPSWYLVAPIPVPPGRQGRNHPRATMGVVLLYQTPPAVGFQQKHRQEALDFTERMALYIQNDQLCRSQERTRNYIKRLQHISTAFPTNVRLANLVDDVYSFTKGVVDVSSALLTLYDRDTDRIYDIFAVSDGKRVEGLPAKPMAPEERPQWWHIVHEEQRRLLLSVDDPEHESYADYEELLTGVWGDQRKARSFLLLPMKMFTRTIGSLCLTSMHPDAYGPEAILVLETMVQIITVSIENAKLYDKARNSLREAKQREQELAAMNSALQAVSSVLNIAELLHNFVEFSAKLVQAEMSTFFQLSPDREELIAHALYAPAGRNKEASTSAEDMMKHRDLLQMIRLPFKGSLLERLAHESFFSLDHSAIEELAQTSTEGGVILLREMGINQMLMIPVRYQTELIGILAIQVLSETRAFNPKEIAALLAVCSQAGSAIRNAQLFEEREEAYAELQRMDKLKDEFLVTASHELRTPLSAIKGYAALLQRQHARATPQQILRSVTKITESTQQLSDLVVTMTDAAQLGSSDKRLAMQIGPVQLLAAAVLARDMLSASIEHKITLDVADDLWVNCDPLRVRQIMSNLLDNAVKYSPLEASIELTASATTLDHLSLPEDQIDPERGDMPVVVVRVRDEGEGIYEEDQPKIFAKFVRASRSLTTAVRGTGLGLYICRRYIDAMGGRIWLERSTPGEGSTFAFYLPRIDAPAEKGEAGELA